LSAPCRRSSADPMQPIKLTDRDALILVDLQNDFLPEGRLPVPCGDETITAANAYIKNFHRAGWSIFATRDWHPPDHCSFREAGGSWPQHCVAGTVGAGFADGLALPGETCVISKGTAREPIIRIEAPLPEAQIVETRLINIINFQTMIASKALRSRIAAPGKLLVDFGFRRAHGSEAGLLAARACCLAGFDGTSNVAAARLFDLPCYGTMAHSYIMAHRDETEAFMQFAAVRPDNLVLLIDTYDTEAGAVKVVEVADRLRPQGKSVSAVRLDSGDLADHARRVRKILDDGGHPDIRIFASSSLDEYALDRICRAGAPIDGFGIGTKMIVSDDAPFLDCAYKLQEYAGVPRYKKSEGKVTLPGRRQVFRNYGRDGKYHHDIIAQADERQPGEPLLIKVMEQGRRLQASESWRQIQERVRNQLKLFPEAFLALTEKVEAQIWISEKLESMMV